MKKRFLALMISAAFVLGSMTACGASDDVSDNVEESVTEAVTEATVDQASETAAEADSDKPTVDRAGNTIDVPEEVDSIISLSPAITQTLIDLGLSDKLVAVDTYSMDYKDDLPEDIPVYDMYTPDQEAMIALEPDVVFTTGMVYAGGDNPYQSVADAGICIIDIPNASSLDGIEEDISFIGDCVDKQDEAQAIVDDMKDKVDELKAKGDSISESDRKSVLFLLSVPSDDSPTLYSVGAGTYLDEIITDVGAVNVAHDEDQWPAISEEAAVAYAPDVILHTVSYVDNATEAITSREGWSDVPAVKSGDVYYIDENISNRPNAHIVDAIEMIGRAIYPDVF